MIDGCDGSFLGGRYMGAGMDMSWMRRVIRDAQAKAAAAMETPEGRQKYYEGQGMTPIDAKILAYMTPEENELFETASDEERAMFIEQRRGDPFYYMTPADFEVYRNSMRAQAVAQSEAGVLREAEAAAVREAERRRQAARDAYNRKLEEESAEPKQAGMFGKIPGWVVAAGGLAVVVALFKGRD